MTQLIDNDYLALVTRFLRVRDDLREQRALIQTQTLLRFSTAAVFEKQFNFYKHSLSELLSPGDKEIWDLSQQPQKRGSKRLNKPTKAETTRVRSLLNKRFYAIAKASIF